MIISRYLTREVSYTLFILISVLLMAFLAQQLVRYLNYVAIGKIPTSVLFELVSFEIPFLLALLLPLGLYLSILYVFGRMHADNEMAILQLSGFNNWRLMKVTSLLISAAALLVLFLMMVVNPWISAKRQQIMTEDEATLHLIETLVPGRFKVSPSGQQVLFVEKLSRDHTVAKNIFFAHTRPTLNAEKPTWLLVLADKGYQSKDKITQDPLFVAEKGYRYEGIPGHNDYKLTQFKKYSERFPTNIVRVVHQEDEALSSLFLLQHYDAPKNAAALQWRISIALLTLILGFFAIPLSALSSKQNRYLILFPAIFIYVLYIELLYTARHWVLQNGMLAKFGMWWVHVAAILCLCIMSFISYRKAHRQ